MMTLPGALLRSLVPTLVTYDAMERRGAELGLADLGRIGSGAVADLLVLDGDPLRDPSVLWGGPGRRAVFQGGIRVAQQDTRLAL